MAFGFNTQPPEGGWWKQRLIAVSLKSFNTQPPEGGWFAVRSYLNAQAWFQHTAARRRLERICKTKATTSTVSTHSRPKAAGHQTELQRQTIQTFQHTAARRRLVGMALLSVYVVMFQHTAARRRLDPSKPIKSAGILFQHTAARRRLAVRRSLV